MLVLVGSERVDLLELVLEQVELALALGGELAQLRQPRLQQTRLRESVRARPQAGLVLGVAEAVEDLQLRPGKGQLAMLVLTVEREQRARHVAQLRERSRAAAQVGAGASVGADAPGEHELLGIGADALAELLAQRLGQVEDPLDVGLAGAGTDDPRPRAAAEQQVEGVREHGLARAGLAGEDVQPARQAQLRLLDQEQILDTQLLQHLTWSTSARGRIATGARSASDARARSGRASARARLVQTPERRA